MAFGPPTTAAALEALRQAAGVADIVELRLDMMDEFDLPRLLANRPCPVIVTYRPEREGGHFTGSEEERIAVLREAIRLGADYVDVELDTIQRIVERGETGLVVSHHDFQAMPPDFAGLWGELRATGADVVKLVGAAHEAAETAPILETLARADVPTVAIAMGDAGLASRVLALRYDACFLTYCALGPVAGTAPGQLSVAELVEVYRGRELGPSTEAIGLIGPRTETERARGYNAALRELGTDAVAVPLLVPEDGDATGTIAALAGLGFAGFLVEVPHQQTVGQALDELERSACRAGKVNVVYRQGDGLVGAWVEAESERFEQLLAGYRE